MFRTLHPRTVAPRQHLASARAVLTSVVLARTGPARAWITVCVQHPPDTGLLTPSAIDSNLEHALFLIYSGLRD